MGAKSTPLSLKRLMNDYQKLQKQELSGVNARPVAGNLYHWEGVIFGPESSPYEYGTFRLTLDFPISYPMEAPNARFDPPIYHPNVYSNGSVCLDILNKAWSPTFNVATILLSVQALLNDPNPNSPANAEAAALYQSNRAEYDKRVRKSVEATWTTTTSMANSPNENGPNSQADS